MPPLAKDPDKCIMIAIIAIISKSVALRIAKIQFRILARAVVDRIPSNDIHFFIIKSENCFLHLQIQHNLACLILEHPSKYAPYVYLHVYRCLKTTKCTNLFFYHFALFSLV